MFVNFICVIDTSLHKQIMHYASLVFRSFIKMFFEIIVIQ